MLAASLIIFGQLGKTGKSFNKLISLNLPPVDRRKLENPVTKIPPKSVTVTLKMMACIYTTTICFVSFHKSIHTAHLPFARWGHASPTRPVVSWLFTVTKSGFDIFHQQHRPGLSPSQVKVLDNLRELGDFWTTCHPSLYSVFDLIAWNHYFPQTAAKSIFFSVPRELGQEPTAMCRSKVMVELS